MLKDLRLWILSALLVALSLSFWTASRYPSLDSKSSMGGAVQLQDSLSFEAVFDPGAVDSALLKTTYTFANWVYINWQGMAFGLAFATLIATAIPLIRGIYQSGGFQSTLVGGLIGVPLGLCVNCSAPLAYGIYNRGGRLETALAAMLSSPALNLVVLGMSIALLPTYLWITKLVASLILIFICVPLIAKLDKRQSGLDAPELETDLPIATEVCKSPVEATLWVFSEVLKNMLQLVLRLVPLMLLAGALGALMVTFLPWDELVRLLPRFGYLQIGLAMLLLGSFALILPVPIALDVVLVAILISAGLPDSYAGVLLFALGSFSVYSFFVLIKARLGFIAILLASLVLAISLVAGYVSHKWGQFEQKKQNDLWLEILSKHESPEDVPLRLNAKTPENIARAPQLTSKTSDNQAISSIELNASSLSSEGLFNLQSVDWGLQLDSPPTFWANMFPYIFLYPIASADINGDSWPDVLSAGFNGMRIYLNTGSGLELAEYADLSELSSISSFAPADLNNDGRIDLVISLFQDKTWVFINNGSGFDRQLLAEHPKSFVTAIALYDFDQNGRLDVMLGMETIAELINLLSPDSRNHLYLQADEGFSEAEFADTPGATLALLVSDIDNDRQPDVLVGNDFSGPDWYYEYSPIEGTFRLWDAEAVSETTSSTMSIDSGDINNDLTLETYHAQISVEAPDSNTEIETYRLAPGYNISYLQHLFLQSDNQVEARLLTDCETTAACEQHRARIVIAEAVRKGDLSHCATLDQQQSWTCGALVVGEMAYRRSIALKQPMSCGIPGDSFPQLRVVCDGIQAAQSSAEIIPAKSIEDGYRQNANKNLLLKMDPANNLSNQSESLGLEYAGWSWNARFADLDGDQWQDIFVANGWYELRADTTNIFYQNRQGEEFENTTADVGLTDFAPTNSYTYVDLDQDADLDLVTYNIYGELKSYINHNTNQHIQFELDDRIGNRSGIGARISIYYGDNQALNQLRELKLSGGYQSFDPSIAHFGLGTFESVARVQVALPDGRNYAFEGPFNSGHRYILQLN